ncbi:tyrosine-type recombinase/integrase [Cellulosimicrobium cellulans]|uniref:tyrosine-type recombinase/integrase n=1 Tax=Cellulosimicrobium cellulans TaxID=1710 RepID=UPI0036E91352
MRRGEICALRWEDIDTGLVRVERSVTQVAQARTYGTPKNHERRQVTIDPRTLAVLKAHCKQQTGQRLAAHVWADDEGLVFTWQDGTPVAPDCVTKEFDRAQAGLGLPQLKLHELRHARDDPAARTRARARRGEVAREQGSVDHAERVRGCNPRR